MLALFTTVACEGSYVEEVSSPVASALSCESKVVVYGSEGATLRQYALDLATGQLAAGASVGFPVTVQYVAVDRKREHLYVSVSNGALSPELFAFDIDGTSGALTPRGASLVPAGGRIINLSVNYKGAHLGLAHSGANQAATVALAADGSLAGEVAQAVPATTGPFPHQAKFDHAGNNLIVPGLALNGGDGTFTVFRVKQGQLTKTQTLTLAPGLGARHVDFDHTGRFVHAVIERGNRLYTYRFKGGQLSPLPLFDQSTLADPANNAIARQRAGAIHVHPYKRFLYLSNRQDTLDLAGALPGENNIAVFALDAATGRPSLLEHVDTRGVEARSFTIDPTGRYLIVGNQVTRTVNGVVIPRSLAVFRIGDSGRLTFLQKYDVSGGDVFWVGAVEL
jgi:6-phosphogluconolactonase (cycloisomerase 2 family)